jgi:hypothetical protein
MEVTKRTKEEVGVALLATITGCREVVAMFASGIMTPVVADGTPIHTIRYAPRFCSGSCTGVPYTQSHVARCLEQLVTAPWQGKTRQVASKWVVAAMYVCEFLEENPEQEPEVLENIRIGKRGFRLISILRKMPALLSELRTMRRVHSVIPKNDFMEVLQLSK